MPRVYAPKKNAKPDLDHTKGGCKLPKLQIEKYIRLGQFDLCLSNDGEELQIWKNNKLVKAFK